LSDFVLQIYKNPETKKVKKFPSLQVFCKLLIFSDKNLHFLKKNHRKEKNYL